MIVVSQTAAKVRLRVAPLSCCGAREHHTRQIRSARALGYGRAVWRRASVLLAVSATACSSPGAQVALPATDGALSALWLADTDEGLRGYALDLAQPIDPAVRVVRDGARAVPLTVVLYPGTLAAAGLAPGPLELDVARGRPPAVLPGATAWTRSYDDDELTPWLPAAAWPTAPVVRRSPCGTLDTVVELSQPAPRKHMLGAVLLPDGSVLLGAAAERGAQPELLRVSARRDTDGRETWVQTSVRELPVGDTRWARTAAEGRAVVAGTSTRGPELWLLDAQGRAGAPEELPARADAIDVAGDTTFLLSGNALWVRRGLGAWQPLGDHAAGPVTAGDRHAAHAVSADEAWLMWPAGRTVTHLRDGVIGGPYPVVMPADERSSELVYHPGLGPLVLSNKGHVYALEGWPSPAPAAPWSRLDDAADGTFLSAALPFDGGVLLGGANGELLELHVGYGLCRLPARRALNVYQLVALTDGRVLVSGTSTLGDEVGATIYILSWSRPS